MRNIRPAILIILAFSFLFFCFAALFSCAGEEAAIDIDLLDLIDYIGETIDLSNTLEYDSQIRDSLGITENDTIQFAALKEINVHSAEILIFAEAKDESAAKEIAGKLEKYKENKLITLRDYTADPENANQYSIVDKSEILIRRQYVFLAVSSQGDKINGMINDYIKNNK